MATQADAQTIIQTLRCGDTDEIREVLEGQYNEVETYRGLRSDTLLEAFWYNAQTGSYSFTRSNIEAGMTCIISAGNFGQELKGRPNL